MPTPFALIALCASAMCLVACDQTTPPPAMPMVEQPKPTESAATTAPAPNTSVPSAASVFPPAKADKTDPALGKPDGTRKPAQASAGTPMPGQNNDHSAPLSPAK